MKKLLSLLLCAAMLLALAACGGSASADADADAAGTEPAAGDETGETAPEGGDDAAEPADDAEEIDFYAMPLDYYTDEVLAENREKLDQTPTGVDIHILNRFTEYLNAAEPAGDSTDVHVMWLYAEVPGDDGEACYQLMTATVPAFVDDAPYYSEEPAGGPQAIVNVRDDGPEEGDGYGKLTSTTYFSSGTCANARERFDALAAESTAGEMFKTQSFDDAAGAGVFTEMYPGPFGMPSENGDTGEYRNHVVALTTELAGGGLNGTDLVCETHFEHEQEVMISMETYNSLTAFFNAIGVPYPEMAFMG